MFICGDKRGNSAPNQNYLFRVRFVIAVLMLRSVVDSLINGVIVAKAGVVAVVVVLVALFEVPRRTKVVTFPGMHNTAQTIRA